MSSDGFTLLGTIAGAPDVFPDIRGEAAKVGRDLVVKQLKTKTLPLSGLRRIYDCIDEQAFKLVIDGMKPAEVKTLVTRLDKENAALKTVDQSEHMRRLLELAAGAEPMVKAAKVAKEKAPKAAAKVPRQGRALGSPAFTAVWDGKDHDAPSTKDRKK